jgi:sarcosine oxidase
MRFEGTVCHQPDGGRIASELAWEVLVAQLERLGGVVRWNTPVRAIEPAGDRVRVVTDDVVYETALAVIAAGGWLAALFDALPSPLRIPELRVSQESAFHFAARAERAWPSFIHHGPAYVYGLETPGEGIKVAEHHTGPEVDATTRDFAVDPKSRARVCEFVERWLPGLDPAPVSEVTCLYTSTEDEAFVLDRVGPLVVASPCSGHGFKFAPLVGELVADLADGAAPLRPFAFRY